MTHLDNLIADSLAQSSDTVVHQLASEVVRLRGAITEALRPFYEGGHIWAKPLEEAIWKPAENLFHKNCRSCICWNGDMCELISHICENGEQWLPSADFVAAHPEVAALVDFAEQMRASASQFSAALDAVQKENADLKRGGVDAAELSAISDAIRRIGNDAHHASTGPVVPDALWDIRGRAYDVCARIDGIRAIPADRVLGEGEVAVDREWRDLVGQLHMTAIDFVNEADPGMLRAAAPMVRAVAALRSRSNALRAQAATEKGEG